jgi:hypothetical protein
METAGSEDCLKSENNNGILNSEIVENGDRFSITKQDALTLSAMAVLSLMAALDGTSISVALPVFHPSLSVTKHVHL